MPAMGTLIDFSAFNNVGASIAAPGAAKAVGPLAFDKISQAVSLGAKPSSELIDRHGSIHFFTSVASLPWSGIIQRIYSEYQVS